MSRNALLVEVTDEDLAWAVRQDRNNCAIVRAIQRKYPQALRVMVDTKTIAFTMPDEIAPEGTQGVRYVFETPKQVVNKVIRPFDEGKPLEAEALTFTVSHAIEAKPMQHRSAEQRTKINQSQRKNREVQRRIGSHRGSNAVKTYNRFLDAEVEYPLPDAG